jgi:probable addiction module antidote protein
MMNYPAFEAADYLDSEAMVAEYLNATLEEQDSAAFYEALGTVAKARSMGKVAQTAGVSRESLYKSFARSAKPRYETVQKVIHALGLRMTLSPLAPSVAMPRMAHS